MRRLLASVAGLTLLLAACNQGGGPGQEGAEVSKVKVGLLYTITGEGAEFAQAALGSAELAKASAARRGIELEVASEDYGGKADRAADLAAGLADDGVSGIVVASDDPDLVPALQDFTRVPLVYALLADDTAVTPSSSAFRVAPSNRMQAEKLASFLIDHRKLTDIAVLHDDSPFGREGAGDLERAIRQEGGRTVLEWEFQPGKDIHTPVTAAGQDSAQALVVWTRESPEAGRITIEIQKAGQGYQLAFSGNLATFEYGKNAASQVTPVAFTDGILSVGTWAGPWFDLPRMRSYYADFQEQNNALAPFQAIQIHDAALLLADAAARARSTDAAAVAEALEETRDFIGAGVPISFAPGSHEGIDMNDMAVLAFTKNQDSAGGDFAPDVSTGGGFFSLDTVSVKLPPDLAYLLQGLPS